MGSVCTVNVFLWMCMKRKKEMTVGNTGLRILLVVAINGVRSVKLSIQKSRIDKERFMNRYFYDQRTKSFLDTCLPSQLNPIRQRKREHDQLDYIQVPPERFSRFPSYVRQVVDNH